MIKKFKCLLTVIISIIIIISIVKISSNSSKNVKVITNNSNVAFNTEFNQCKTIIEDTSTRINQTQTKTINDFQMKYIDAENYNSDTQFNKEFIPFLQSKMTDALSSNNIDYISKLVDASRTLTLNSNKEIGNLNAQLIELSGSLQTSANNPSSTNTVEPTIGMTSDEVRISTWGNPNSINKTILASGTDEQWIYSNYRYVYIKNGVVTSIQTH